MMRVPTALDDTTTPSRSAFTTNLSHRCQANSLSFSTVILGASDLWRGPVRGLLPRMARRSPGFLVAGSSLVASLTIENYAKAIYQISAREGGQSAATGQLAEALRVSPGTVTSMLKT